MLVAKRLTPRRAATQSGFTLIELLVVVAIIAILASILFPIFETARESARKTACLNNEKQIGIAFLAYADDNRDFLPGCVVPAGNEWKSWDTLLAPYLRNNSVLECPSDGATRQDGKLPRSYSMNDQMVRYRKAYTGEGIRLSILHDSTLYVLLTEQHVSANVQGGVGTPYNWKPPSFGQYYHNSKTGNNFLFFDGHVRFFSTGQLDEKTNFTFDPI